MVEKVIRVIGLINGGDTAYDGQYVVEYDPGRDGTSPDGKSMICHLVTTPNVEQATRYSTEEAFETWKAVDPRRPVRPDGKPNRPLTAFTVEIGPPEEQEKQ